ncbi:MAG: hypothetical protein EOM67_14860 [Spirochaetia bacterium]|nr:hypothetical protein [Spirochaetia bacterium]
MENLDLRLIKTRKEEYGNNLPDMAKDWTLMTEGKYQFTPEKVAEFLSNLKQNRIKFIIEALKTTTIGTDKYFNLKKALEDSFTDRDNYLWIADHYTEYVEL